MSTVTDFVPLNPPQKDQKLEGFPDVTRCLAQGISRSIYEISAGRPGLYILFFQVKKKRRSERPLMLVCQ
jgi:hypothetical protein